MSDRYSRALWAGQGFNLGIELLRERFYDSRSEAGFWLSKHAVRLANPIVRDRNLPIRSFDIIRDDDLTFDIVGWERMLQSIHDEFGNDQAETSLLHGT